MNKDKLLRSLATNGYNVGFGAKKNFASHDIIVKLPSWIGFITLSIGILQLGYTSLGNNKELSATLILVSVASLYISIYNSSSDKFEKEGIRCTKLFNQLRDLYFSVQAQSKNDYNIEADEMKSIMDDFYTGTITKQVFLSQWFAHFKFFYEMQIDWVDEQLKFKFFKDKFPNSLKSFLLTILLSAIIIFAYEYLRHFR